MKEPEKSELILKAFRAYYTRCRKERCICPQPEEQDTVMGNRYIYLYNTDGCIAKYDYRKGKLVIPPSGKIC